MFAATLVSQAPAGVALDRFGPRRVLQWALALVTLGTALFAVAPDMNEAAWPAVLVAHVLIDAGLAATGASVQMALAQNMPSGDYGYALDLSRFDAAPLIAFTATKEIDYETETDGRIPPGCGADRADQWANT